MKIWRGDVNVTRLGCVLPSSDEGRFSEHRFSARAFYAVLRRLAIKLFHRPWRLVIHGVSGRRGFNVLAGFGVNVTRPAALPRFHAGVGNRRLSRARLDHLLTVDAACACPANQPLID
jgi:hypothetical protein